MTISRTSLAAVAAILLSCMSGSAVVFAQYAPDNTRQNKTQSPNADSQPNEKSDRMMLAEVRKAIMADKELSTYAHNVKIIVRDGQVTLKGPVNSEDEKNKVFMDATSAAGSYKVINQLTVKQ